MTHFRTTIGPSPTLARRPIGDRSPMRPREPNSLTAETRVARPRRWRYSCCRVDCTRMEVRGVTHRGRLVPAGCRWSPKEARNEWCHRCGARLPKPPIYLRSERPPNWSHFSGSTFSPLGKVTSKCRCGPVEFPRFPTVAICCPALTRSPTATRLPLLCP